MCILKAPTTKTDAHACVAFELTTPLSQNVIMSFNFFVGLLHIIFFHRKVKFASFVVLFHAHLLQYN